MKPTVHLREYEPDRKRRGFNTAPGLYDWTGFHGSMKGFMKLEERAENAYVELTSPYAACVQFNPASFGLHPEADGNAPLLQDDTLAEHLAAIGVRRIVDFLNSVSLPQQSIAR